MLGHGFGGIADRRRVQATGLARGGFAAFAIDYRSFGHSDGSPRQVVDLRGQRQDLRNAVEFARHLGGIDPDRIALWGVSLGGAHVVYVAAEGAPVRAVVCQVPFNGYPRRARNRTAAQTLRLMGAIALDKVRRRLRRAPYLIPMVGRPGELALTTSVDAERHIASLGEGSTWRNEVAPGALLDMARYKPSTVAHRVTVPLMVCVAEHDTETPAALGREIADRAPQGVVRSYPATHMDFYGDEQLLDTVIADQVAFLRSALA